MIKKFKLCLLVSIFSLQSSSHLFAMEDEEKEQIKHFQIKKEKYTNKITTYKKQLDEVELKLEKLNFKASQNNKPQEKSALKTETSSESLTDSSSDIQIPAAKPIPIPQEQLILKTESASKNPSNTSSEIPSQYKPAVTPPPTIIKDPDPSEKKNYTPPTVKKSSIEEELSEFLNRNWVEYQPQKYSTVYNGYHIVIIENKGSHNAGIRKDKTNDQRHWINDNESIEDAKRAAFKYVHNKK